MRTRLLEPFLGSSFLRMWRALVHENLRGQIAAELFCPYFQVDFFGAHEHNADEGFFYLGYQLTGRKMLTYF